VDADGRVRGLPAIDVRALSRQSLQAYLDNAAMVDDALFAGLHGEQSFLELAPHKLRKPQVFYYGHAAAFNVNKLLLGGLISESERVNPAFEQLFEAGVDEHPHEKGWAKSQWPAVAEVLEYRKAVHRLVSRVIARVGDEARGVAVDQTHPLWALLMGIEHQRVHTETSSVLFREMPLALLQPSAQLAPPHPSAARACRTPTPEAGLDFPATELLASAGGRAELGRHGEPEFGWDLEYGLRAVEVAPFETGRCKVSNGDYFAFVQAGGYARRKDLWSEEGWAWRELAGAQRPRFWCADGKLRLVFQEVEMQWDWPAVVNHHEAVAFCAWRSEAEALSPARAFRPASEAELALLRARNAQAHLAAGEPYGTDGGLGAANRGLQWASEQPVNAGRPAFETKHHDLLGNVWEHCVDEAAALEGYEPHKLYLEYSEPAFDGRHHMLVGGSFASSGGFASARTRNYFRPHFLQHAGFRLARSAA